MKKIPFGMEWADVVHKDRLQVLNMEYKRVVTIRRSPEHSSSHLEVVLLERTTTRVCIQLTLLLNRTT